jgi:hypothetical protein
MWRRLASIENGGSPLGIDRFFIFETTKRRKKVSVFLPQPFLSFPFLPSLLLSKLFPNKKNTQEPPFFSLSL